MTDLTGQIDAIVQEVVRRLLPSIAPAPADSGPEPGAAVLAERLITVERLVHLNGLNVQRLQVGPRAVVTPAARDWLAERRIQLIRVSPVPTTGPTGSSPIQTVLSQTVPTKTVDAATTARLWWLNDAADDRRTTSLHRAAARSIAQLAPVPTDGDQRDPARRAATLPTVGRGIWLTSRPAAALCAANRRTEVHAAWGLDYRSLEDAFRQLPVNWLIVDPQRLSIGDWPRMVHLLAEHPHGSHPYRGVS